MRTQKQLPMLPIQSRRWATEHQDNEEHWVQCTCSVTRNGVIKSSLEHRIRELHLIDVEVTKKEWA